MALTTTPHTHCLHFFPWFSSRIGAPSACPSCSIILWGSFAPARRLLGARGCLPATPREGRLIRPPGCRVHTVLHGHSPLRCLEPVLREATMLQPVLGLLAARVGPRPYPCPPWVRLQPKGRGGLPCVLKEGRYTLDSSPGARAGLRGHGARFQGRRGFTWSHLGVRVTGGPLGAVTVPSPTISCSDITLVRVKGE